MAVSAPLLSLRHRLQEKNCFSPVVDTDGPDLPSLPGVLSWLGKWVWLHGLHILTNLTELPGNRGPRCLALSFLAPAFRAAHWSVYPHSHISLHSMLSAAFSVLGAQPWTHSERKL